MFVIKSSQYVTPLKQISSSKRFISGDVKSRSGKKLETNSKLKNSDRLPNESLDKSSPFAKEDLHTYGLNEMETSTIKSSLFPKQDIKSSSSSGLGWTKEEIQTLEHPIDTGIHKFAEKVENGKTAHSSEAYQASKETTDRAAHLFANNANKASHSVDGLRSGLESVASSMGGVQGETKSDGPNYYRETRFGGIPEPSLADKAKETMKEGLEKITEKISNAGQNLAGSMKGIEGVAESLAHMSMPKSVVNTTESIKSAASSIKDSLPKSAEEAKDTAWSSMESAKGVASSVKDSMPSMPSMEAIKETVSDKATTAKDTAWNSVESAKGMASSVKDSMPSMPSMEAIKETVSDKATAAKDTAWSSMESAKGTAWSSVESAKGMASSVKDSMPSMPSMETIKETVSDKATAAKDTVNAVGETSAGIYESFKQNVNTMKEAMKPVVDFASEKIPPIAASLKDNLKTGATFAAEKIPPMAQTLKEKADALLHSQAAESIKGTVSSGAKGAFEMAKEKVSTVMMGKSEGQKLDIQEETITIKKSELDAKAKDQEMSSSDIYKP